MKSSERHKLKSNELADSLVELKDYFSKNGSRIIAALIVILVVILGFSWWHNSQQEQKIQQMASLQAFMVNNDVAQNQAVSYALNPKAKGAKPYKPEQIEAQLGVLANNSAGTPVGAIALLKRGDIIRSKMYLSGQAFTEKEKQDMRSKAKNIYEQIIKEYSGLPLIAGQAKLGLAMLAEEQGQWDKAKQLYEQLASNKQKALAGTVIPFQASERLQILSNTNIKKPVKFSLAPTPTPKVSGNNAGTNSGVKPAPPADAVTTQPEKATKE